MYKIDSRLWNEEVNKAIDIETRALNYPWQDCYDWQDIEERDHIDTTRDVSPLSKAKDAYTVDTTDLSLDEVVFQIFECKDRVKSRSKQS